MKIGLNCQKNHIVTEDLISKLNLGDMIQYG